MLGFGACALILALALGVGLGVGLNRNKGQATSAPTTSTTNTTNSTGSNFPTAPQHGILNDTSLAAAASFEGNRHLFFQGFNGSIRHATFGQSINSWLTQSDYVYTNTTPRMHTPMSTVAVGIGGNSTGVSPNEIHLFYINENNFIEAISYFEGEAADGAPLLMNDSFPVAADTRSLSVIRLGLSQNDTAAEAALFYEAPNGNVTTLWGYYYGFKSGNPQWIWHNVSEAIYDTVRNNNTWLSAPFASTAVTLGNEPPSSIYAAFANPIALLDPSAPPAFSLSFSDWSSLGEQLYRETSLLVFLFPLTSMPPPTLSYN